MPTFDSRDVHHCPILLSRSTNFSSPLQVLQTLVLGFMSPLFGWVNDLLDCISKAVLKGRGFRPKSFDNS